MKIKSKIVTVKFPKYLVEFHVKMVSKVQYSNVMMGTYILYRKSNLLNKAEKPISVALLQCNQHKR